MAVHPLHLRRYGVPGSTPVLPLHGLFGSGANWHGVARRLAQRRPVLVPDLRNHGDSPHDPIRTSRADADRRLAHAIPQAAIRGYVLQGLRRDGAHWRWRPNLPVIATALPAIRGFPDALHQQFTGPALFLYGTRSDYVDARARRHPDALSAGAAARGDQRWALGLRRSARRLHRRLGGIP